MRIHKDFTFDAAHHLPHFFPEGHPNHRLHGHSYRVRVWIEGAPDPQTGLILDFDSLYASMKEAREALDHRYLNEDVPGLEKPSLENIALWLWDFLSPRAPGLAQIGVYRDNIAEGCEYAGELS
ncbi:MAG: 6-carboxytetrahydropterin synthase [Neomegalonema sp.]|nr:6-carboxytetrahydropterin synthase [Neomegalonema sp.]